MVFLINLSYPFIINIPCYILMLPSIWSVDIINRDGNGVGSRRVAHIPIPSHLFEAILKKIKRDGWVW